MRYRVLAISVFALAIPASVRASVSVEQIEAYEVDSGDDANAPTRYATVDFAGTSSVTLQAGQLGGFFAGITFHALGAETATNSNHAYAVGDSFYGDTSVAYPFVTDVYAAPNTLVLTTTADTQPTTGIAAAPGSFAAGVAVVNNSYVYSTGSAASDLDLQRRLDFMIDQSDTTFVAAAVSNITGTNYDIPWTSYNALAVNGGAQTFAPTNSQGKQHADLFVTGLASFSSAVVASDAAALYGTAQTAGQTDALHGVVIRSLLMAGADKTSYVRQTTNNLDVAEGAGIANYATSLAILNAGEQPLLSASAGGTITGTPTTALKGWSEGIVAANAQDVVLFHSYNLISGLTASLNWDVTQSQPSPGQIDTSNSGTIFADLGLEVRPVTLVNGSYVLGASLTDTTLRSDATGDNVQYLYSTSALVPGDYAFVITGDASISPVVGFSYTLAGILPDQFKAAGGGSWALATNWAGNIIPDAPAAQANFTGATGVAAATLTLDGNQTIGKLFLSGSTNYTIAPGTGGTLTINDTNDSTVDAMITVSSGNHVISAPVALTSGVTASITALSSLDISGAITGSGGLTKSGTGTLTLDGVDNFGATTINAGTVNLSQTGKLNGGIITVNSAATLNVTASTTAGIFDRTLGSGVTLATGGTMTIAEPTAAANRQLLIAPNIIFAGSTDNWTGHLEVGKNDLDLTGASLADITNQVKEGFVAGATQGITSADAATDTNHLTTLGVIVNNDGAGHTLYSTSTTLGLFDGKSPAASDILVKYTTFGDANLDGAVNAADYALIDTGFAGHLTGWYHGDFNYDGVIDGSDFTLIDNSFNVSNLLPQATDTAQIATAVPEPAGGVLLTSAAVILAKRRRLRKTQ